MNGKPFLVLKVSVILLVCAALAYFTPKVQPTQTEAAVLKGITIFSFVFFLAETGVCIFVFGLVRGKDAYLRRDYMHILNMVLLGVELLYLTPLSGN